MPLIESQRSELEKEIDRIIQDADIEEEKALWRKSKVKKKSFLRSATDLFFEPKPWERWQGGRMYELLGINIFRKYLLGPLLMYSRSTRQERTGTYFIGDRKSLEDIKYMLTKQKLTKQLTLLED